LAKLHIDWYAWVMKGGRKPEFLQNNVAYYVTGAAQWRYADSLEAVTATHDALYLSSSKNRARLFSSGVLGKEPTNGCEEDTYTYNPRELETGTLEATFVHPWRLRPTFPTDNLADQRPTYARDGKQLVYHSEPLERDIEISGFFRFSAWIAIDQPDTDFGVSVYEVGTDGSCLLLTADSMRARYRESLRQERLVHTVNPLRYDFERFTFVARLIKKGCRLRLIVGPLDSIYFERNGNTGGPSCEEALRDARPVTVRLFHGKAHPSALYVPVGTGNR
jgi:putative CocE/NonD family hydrolase